MLEILEHVMPVEAYEAHQRDKAERQARLDANRPLHEACCNPTVAATYEMRKPQYRWTVDATWNAPGEAGGFVSHHETFADIVAQNEADAWAGFCDRLLTYPSRRNAKVTFTQGERVSAEEHAAASTSLPFSKAGPRN